MKRNFSHNSDILYVSDIRISGLIFTLSILIGLLHAAVNSVNSIWYGGREKGGGLVWLCCHHRYFTSNVCFTVFTYFEDFYVFQLHSDVLIKSFEWIWSFFYFLSTHLVSPLYPLCLNFYFPSYNSFYLLFFSSYLLFSSILWRVMFQKV